jgi:V/A-type H+-transporting ATPase subunit I
VEEKATPEEKPPILLKNKEFSKKFEMIGELYSLPKYGELDLTPFFAPFYMLFFGFCLGDAGYGILMAILALVFKKKVSKPLKPVLGLVFYLGLSTILFGLIGGTFFGIPLYETGLPVYSTLAERFAAEGTDINNLLFYLALFFGGVQIIFGLFIKAINETKQFGWGFALGTIGWILLLVGGITIYLITMISNIPPENMKIAQYILLGVSGLLILPLNNLGRNVFMNIGSGLWNTYNMITGLLGDLLSYIRLFALGISSAILGLVFNSLAVQMSGDIPVLNILIMVVILVIGHSINIFMSGLGAFVHPLRLTFVEFYKNAGFTGGGKKYEPFKKLT